jgi:hypothetical protein
VLDQPSAVEERPFGYFSLHEQRKVTPAASAQLIRADELFAPALTMPTGTACVGHVGPTYAWLLLLLLLLPLLLGPL